MNLFDQAEELASPDAAEPTLETITIAARREVKLDGILLEIITNVTAPMPIGSAWLRRWHMSCARKA
jgi:hypothetical protein